MAGSRMAGHSMADPPRGRRPTEQLLGCPSHRRPNREQKLATKRRALRRSRFSFGHRSRGEIVGLTWQNVELNNARIGL
jgi:hypothetical protein